jgi:hypothetical protein
MATIKERTEILEGVPLFESLSKRQLRNLANHGQSSPSAGEPGGSWSRKPSLGSWRSSTVVRGRRP